MSGPIRRGDAIGAELTDGDRVEVAIRSRGFLLADVALDRGAAVDLVEEIEDALSRLDWRTSDWLLVELAGGTRHLVANGPGWETRPSLCGRRWPSWRSDWVGRARPLQGDPETALDWIRRRGCASCRRSVELRLGTVGS